jgi:2-polyprenyl-3-methyl-5-hydroxy-6-metoxy-1,4-benzoquinol methylase
MRLALRCAEISAGKFHALVTPFKKWLLTGWVYRAVSGLVELMAHSTDMFSVEEDPFFVEDLLQMSRAENYLRWQLDLVAPFIRGRVLEVGGGIGNFTPELARLADSLISIEPNAYCHAQLIEKTRGTPNISVHHATVEVLDQKIPANTDLDTVVMMNVLEHIQDDQGMLEKLKRRLKVGGRIVLLVPAGPWAFGKIDERLGHYRRYSKASARQLMGELSLEMEKLRYFNFIGVWAWWWNARVTKRQSQNNSQIHFFNRYLVPVISRVEKWIPIPVGQSLLVVARKNRQP